jgi:alkanesulfonate monooxygenase SsuD/methylene tetrahydromethanopterin reductase-like flavin-dependent oxidoreductase (luciferase family)
MKIGLFDHVEEAGRPVSVVFDERLQFAAAADAAGFYCLHVAEHHATPLNLVPAPSVYLSAVARATKTMRLGPLVYLLPLYSPLRLIEEICMLDHLSHGRLDVGVGRGVSPYEVEFHNVMHAETRDIFVDAFECLSKGLSSETLTYERTCRSRCVRYSSRTRHSGMHHRAKWARPGPANTGCIT